MSDDGEAVRTAIRDCEPPVVVADWSAGGASMDIGAEGESAVARLVDVASYPSAPQDEPEDLAWIDKDPNLSPAR